MKFIITLNLLLLACCAYAQPLPPTPDPVPLDGGIIGLLVAGAVYGVNRKRSSTKN